MSFKAEENTEKLLKISRTIWDAFLGGKGISQLLNTAGELLGCWAALVSGLSFWSAEKSPLRLENELDAERLGRWCSSRVVDNFAENIKLPEEFLSSEQPAAVLIHAVEALALPDSFLIACRGEGSFSANEVHILEDLANMCAAQLLRTASYNGGSSFESNMFAAMLRGDAVDANKLRRMGISGCPDGHMMQVLVIGRCRDGRADMYAVGKSCSLLINCSMWTLMNNSAVLLYNGRSPNALAENQEFRRLLEDNHCNCGMSRRFIYLRDVAPHYEQAKAAADFGMASAAGKLLYDYDDFALEHLIYMSSSGTGGDGLLSPRLRALKEFDADNNTELMKTLKIYLDNISNLKAAAEALHVHRNTLFYRLRKIEDITGWDLNDGGCLSNVAFYLRVDGMMEVR